MSSSVCRSVAKKTMLKVQGDSLLCGNPMDLFDYSTNLPGYFELEHNFISLTGNNRKYFRAYWDFVEEVNVPQDNIDFEIDDSKGYFFLPIERIHKQLNFPFQKPPKNSDDSITAVVEHTPTNSNFWHFSIRWINTSGEIIKPTDSQWKNKLVGTMRAALLELLEVTEPAISTLPSEYYTKNVLPDN